MSSDLNQPMSRSFLKGANLRISLLSEVQKAKERLNSTPHPYCELDCPWLRACQLMARKISPLGCFLSDLTDSNLWLSNDNR
jgi:hypothetical protein